MEEALAALKATGRLPRGEQEEEPATRLWLLLLLAQMEDYAHHTAAALAYLEEATAHTPTCYDVYLEKARVLRHAGALAQAEASVRVGSELDHGDRFMNTELTKAQLACGQVAAALETVSYWTKKDVPAVADLNEMQACWFETRAGEAFLAKKDVAHANRMFANVCGYFDQFVLDQFDFHPYVLRKNTLTSYTRFLRVVDQLFDHPYYLRAALGRVRCALLLHETPIDETAAGQFPSLFKEGVKKEDDVDGVKVGPPPGSFIRSWRRRRRWQRCGRR